MSRNKIAKFEKTSCVQGWFSIVRTREEQMQKKITELRRKIKKYDHFKCTCIISMITIIMFILSLTITCSPWQSIIPNVFAGLLTGLVVTLIGSYKSKTIKDTEIERKFLEGVHDRYLSADKMYRGYRKNRHAEADEYYSAVYELATEMEAVESYIEQKNTNPLLLRIIGQKPSDLFKDGLDYDFSEQTKRHKNLIDLLDSNMEYNDDVRKKIDDMINDIRRAHRMLNYKVFNLMSTLDDQKIEIETSIP